MPSSELEQLPEYSPRRLGRVVGAWVAAAVATVAGGVSLALWGLGLTSKLSSSTSNVLDVVKLAFAFVAGVGGTLGLILAYRRHQLAERAALLEAAKELREKAKEVREDTKLFNDRFEKAAGLLGSDLYAVRLAGVYAMAGLADDWAEGRQRCVDVLCANIRRSFPLEPDLDEDPVGHQTWSDGQEFRQTIIQAIATRLRDSDSKWHGLSFDFRAAILDRADFNNISFNAGRMDFTGATFGTVDFQFAKFSGGEVFFRDVLFEHGSTYFNSATFEGSLVLFSGSEFSSGGIVFHLAKFTGGDIHFNDTMFTGATVDFGNSKFSGSNLKFDNATLEAGTVNFTETAFTAGTVSFSATPWSKGARFTGSHVDFSKTTFMGGALDLGQPHEWKTPPKFSFNFDTPPAGVILPKP